MKRKICFSVFGGKHKRCIAVYFDIVAYILVFESFYPHILIYVIERRSYVKSVVFGRCADKAVNIYRRNKTVFGIFSVKTLKPVCRSDSGGIRFESVVFIDSRYIVKSVGG